MKRAMIVIEDDGELHVEVTTGETTWAIGVCETVQRFLVVDEVIKHRDSRSRTKKTSKKKINK